MLTVQELLNSELMKKINNTNYKSIQASKAHYEWNGKINKKGKLKKERKISFNERLYKKIPKKYLVYIKSKWWKRRKNQYFRIHGKKCAVCKSSNYIQLHHKFYGKYYFEEDSDLIALCTFHHKELHLAIGKTKRDMRQVTDDFILEMKRNPYREPEVVHIP